jgi:hypothetical protein
MNRGGSSKAQGQLELTVAEARARKDEANIVFAYHLEGGLANANRGENLRHIRSVLYCSGASALVFQVIRV